MRTSLGEGFFNADYLTVLKLLLAGNAHIDDRCDATYRCYF